MDHHADIMTRACQRACHADPGGDPSPDAFGVRQMAIVFDMRIRGVEEDAVGHRFAGTRNQEFGTKDPIVSICISAAIGDIVVQRRGGSRTAGKRYPSCKRG